MRCSAPPQAAVFTSRSEEFPDAGVEAHHPGRYSVVFATLGLERRVKL
jgi:hypothetical protein